ncbi:MAG: 2-oxo acid dehydrogenase subunit E2 [Gemmatimonadota bacterium]|nr:2-oxo acid dehydrogenase subunit E2 [Gemmatimonadota bacterium]MDH5282481.1 2-oxo acid dehydrogenase subunit E2 [Gemmatimonadota bacterium]
MATKILMEALSPTMEEGRLVEWKKKEGDPVAVGEILAEVETDKAVMDLQARAAGVLLKQVIVPGTTVPVGNLVGVIGTAGEDISAVVGGSSPPSKPPAAKAAAVPPAAATPQPAPATSGTPVPGGRLKASPLARKIAADRGVDLAGVSGSGPEGRIVARDLEGAAASPTASPAPRSTLRAGSGEPFRDVPLTQLRKTIAKRLAQSIGPIPTFYLTTEVDMERVAEARQALAASDLKISFNDIVVKAVALALRQHPGCNAWWQDDRIRYWNEVHVSMAVAIEDGLITPVIRHADLKSLREIGAESRDLAARARDRRLTPEEYTGGTFSVSNLGMFDIDQFTAVINPPEAGILAVGSVTPKPVAEGDRVVVRRRMRVTLSCDHRVIDGATGAAFLRTLKQMLENPLAMLA